MQPTNLVLVNETIQRMATIAATEYHRIVNGNVDHYPCGFAWVVCTPKNKGNTKQGRKEREILKAIGFENPGHGKHLELYMPGRIDVQNMHVHEAGAKEAAKVIRNTPFMVDNQMFTFDVHVQSRMD